MSQSVDLRRNISLSEATREAYRRDAGATKPLSHNQVAKPVEHYTMKHLARLAVVALLASFLLATIAGMVIR